MCIISFNRPRLIAAMAITFSACIRTMNANSVFVAASAIEPVLAEIWIDVSAASYVRQWSLTVAIVLQIIWIVSVSIAATRRSSKMFHFLFCVNKFPRPHFMPQKNATQYPPEKWKEGWNYVFFAITMKHEQKVTANTVRVPSVLHARSERHVLMPKKNSSLKQWRKECFLWREWNDYLCCELRQQWSEIVFVEL